MAIQLHTEFWAGGFLYDRVQASVFLHHRDGNTRMNPHKWAFFGGHSEAGETYLACFVREIAEEIGLHIEPEQAVYLREYLNPLVNQYRVVFYIETDIAADRLVLGEGAGFGWFRLDEVHRLDLAQKTREDLVYFVEHHLR
jgi:8-oxo-dGTP pyrophosphatase MutT (NUDIX family)